MAVVASEGFLGLLHPARPSNYTSFNLIIRSKKHDLKSPSFPSPSSSSSSSEAPKIWPFSISSSPLPVPSLLKAVQFTGAGQSLSSVSRQALLLLPDLPYTLINEIKKRVSLPFLEDGREEIREDEIPAENQSAATDNSLGVEESMVFARCAWPRKDPSHLNQAMEASNNSIMNSSTSVLAEMAVINSSACTLNRERQGVNILEAQGPRCAWPREIKHGLMMQANGNSEQGEAMMQVIEGGAKCGWPRVINGKAQSSSCMMMTSNSATTKPDQAGEEIRVIEGGAKCAWPRINGKAQSSSSMPSSSSVNACAAAEQQEKKKKEAAAMVEGPRCVWPRASSSLSMTPCDPSKSCGKSLYPPEDFQRRRMLATSIGVSMVNYYLLVAVQSPSDLLALSA